MPLFRFLELHAITLGNHAISHTYVTDNACGHLMQRGMVDMVIVGTDRTTSRGDVCNKIGTYLKALAVNDNNIPFYVALPSPTIDWTMEKMALLKFPSKIDLSGKLHTFGGVTLLEH